MARNTRPIQFRDHLPEIFRADEVDGVSFLSTFLLAFESVFEELEAALEGTPGGRLQLTVQSVSGTTVNVAAFDTGPVGFPISTPITLASQSSGIAADPRFDEGQGRFIQDSSGHGQELPIAQRALRTTLGQAIPAHGTGLIHIEVQDAAAVSALGVGDRLSVHAGGIPDLFSPDTTPPPQFTRREKSNDLDFLRDLASWIVLPLRADLVQHEGETDAQYDVRRTQWNRHFFHTALPLLSQRGTLPGLDALLRAWLKGDLRETTPPDPPLLVLTDLTPATNEVDAIFQLDQMATLDVDTVLGAGPPFFFIADVITDPAVPELRTPVGLDALQRAARSLLDAEKPGYTYYQLRVRASTMQLAPPRGAEVVGETYAQVGDTTLLWDAPWVFDSDG